MTYYKVRTDSRVILYLTDEKTIEAANEAIARARGQAMLDTDWAIVRERTEALAAALPMTALVEVAAPRITSVVGGVGPDPAFVPPPAQVTITLPPGGEFATVTAQTDGTVNYLPSLELETPDEPPAPPKPRRTRKKPDAPSAE